MAHSAYIVLETYPSSSSDKIYEVRRGGDSVLYCNCLGWAHSKSVPKMCKHTKDFVAKNPGTSYGPDFPAVESAPMAKQPAAAKATQPASKAVPTANVVPAAKAGADWRAQLLNERRAAASRGVVTPPAALTAYARELDLD